MASKFFRGFTKVFSGPKTTKFGTTKYATIGGVKPKISTKKADQIKKSNRLLKKLDKTMKKPLSPKMRTEGKKLKKEVKETQKIIYRSKFAMGGVIGAINKLRGKEENKKPKSKEEINKITSSDAYKKGDYKTKTKMLGGQVSTAKEMEEKIKKQKPSIKEKILPKKKQDRLNELRKELGMKKGGSALKPVDKEKNPGLAKLPTKVRNKMGYMKKGGSVRKFGGGKK